MNRKILTLLPALLLPLVDARAQEGGSTFGHARTRESAELGRLPTAGEVAVADIVNYHRHRLPLPRAGEPVALDLRFGGDVGPHRPAVLQIGITTAPAGDRRDLPPLNLALVIDCSGSMQEHGKMEQVKRSLGTFVRRLRPSDRIALVTYSDEARLTCPSRPVDDGYWIASVIRALVPSGSTNLHAGLMLGLREASAHAGHGTSNRVILLTDGIANRGVTDPAAILEDACSFTTEGVDLSTIGVGGNLNTELLDRLARGSRGLFHFVADPQDIAKVFVAEMDSLVTPVARQVRLQVDLSRDLIVDEVYGYSPLVCEHGSGFRIDLPDINQGMTAVVLATCRIAEPSSGPPPRVNAVAKLEYQAADAPRRDRVVADAVCEVRRRGGDRLQDPEVRKNFTIAVLAKAMNDMARCADDRRWWPAWRQLDGAIRFAYEQFPNAEDSDLRTVLEMAEGHRRTLKRYLDHFRD